ncbi:hypothetical protein JCGZ_03747 [Jatropha curcas]|uniref:Uncharacterized protein n=1 Tax=Jatropha curcas TaxID=180498 RepID=A0A067L1G4_JATCU|nr:hypothetical protein JCGZ_03747 [Jatropha curcas]
MKKMKEEEEDENGVGEGEEKKEKGLLRKQHRQPLKVPKLATTVHAMLVEARITSSKDDITGGSMETERNKVVSFKGDIYSFNLENLLGALAKVLVYDFIVVATHSSSPSSLLAKQIPFTESMAHLSTWLYF